MLRLQRVRVTEIEVRAIPDRPGVYAWFRSAEPIYAGKASGGGGLRERIGKHLGMGPDLSRSSLRRNVAEHVLFVPTSVSRKRPSVMSSELVSRINALHPRELTARRPIPNPPHQIFGDRRPRRPKNQHFGIRKRCEAPQWWGHSSPA